MPVARRWTAEADKVICDMRIAGHTWADIARTLSLSRNTVIERGRRLNAVAPARAPMSKDDKDMLDDRNRPPLPAGHWLTWALLTAEPFPERG